MRFDPARGVPIVVALWDELSYFGWAHYKVPKESYRCATRLVVSTQVEFWAVGQTIQYLTVFSGFLTIGRFVFNGTALVL